MIKSVDININLPPKWSQFLFEDYRYKIVYGGRGSAKSWTIATALLVDGIKQPLKIFCGREIQGSIRDSVHSLLRERIFTLGMNELYDCGESFIRGKNGTEVIYKGLRANYAEIKSMEGVDRAWIEEAQAVSDDSWNTLIPTIRKPKSQIWISFNPLFRTDATYRRFIINTPPDAKAVKVNYDQNPWFTKELEAERLHCKETQPNLYANIWEGEPLQDGELSFFEYADIEKAMRCENAHMGRDLVVGVDPSQGKGDRACFAFRYGDYVEKIESFSGMDELACVGYIVQLLRGLPQLNRVVVDSTGFGNTIVALLHEQGFRGKVFGVNFSEASQNQTYANRRAECHGELRYWLRYGNPVKLPNLPELAEEMCAIQWKPTSNGKTILEPKDDIKARLGRSPDLVDALALCFSIPAISVTMQRANRPVAPASRGKF